MTKELWTINAKALYMPNPKGRIASIFRVCEDNKFQIAVCQEISMEMIGHLKVLGYKVHEATPNTIKRVGRLKGQTVGNAIVVGSRVKALDTDELVLKTKGDKGRSLHCPVVLAQWDNQARVGVIDLHLLSGQRGQHHDWHEINIEDVWSYIHEQNHFFQSQGWPAIEWLVMGDVNDTKLLTQYDGFQNDIDQIRCFTGGLKIAYFEVFPFAHRTPRWSDHDGFAASMADPEYVKGMELITKLSK